MGREPKCAVGTEDSGDSGPGQGSPGAAYNPGLLGR